MPPVSHMMFAHQHSARITNVHLELAEFMESWTARRRDYGHYGLDILLRGGRCQGDVNNAQNPLLPVMNALQYVMTE